MQLDKINQGDQQQWKRERSQEARKNVTVLFKSYNRKIGGTNIIITN